MRLRAEFWVKAYIRRCAVEGASAVVVRHGDDDAGAIFIKVDRLDGTCAVFGPAPAGLVGAESDRRWVALLSRRRAPEQEPTHSWRAKRVRFRPVADRGRGPPGPPLPR